MPYPLVSDGLECHSVLTPRRARGGGKLRFWLAWRTRVRRPTGSPNAMSGLSAVYTTAGAAGIAWLLHDMLKFVQASARPAPPHARPTASRLGGRIQGSRTNTCLKLARAALRRAHAPRGVGWGGHTGGLRAELLRRGARPRERAGPAVDRRACARGLHQRHQRLYAPRWDTATRRARLPAVAHAVAHAVAPRAGRRGALRRLAASLTLLAQCIGPGRTFSARWLTRWRLPAAPRGQTARRACWRARRSCARSRRASSRRSTSTSGWVGPVRKVALFLRPCAAFLPCLAQRVCALRQLFSSAAQVISGAYLTLCRPDPSLPTFNCLARPAISSPRACRPPPLPGSRESPTTTSRCVYALGARADTAAMDLTWRWLWRGELESNDYIQRRLESTRVKRSDCLALCQCGCCRGSQANAEIVARCEPARRSGPTARGLGADAQRWPPPPRAG